MYCLYHVHVQSQSKTNRSRKVNTWRLLLTGILIWTNGMLCNIHYLRNLFHWNEWPLRQVSELHEHLGFVKLLIDLSVSKFCSLGKANFKVTEGELNVISLLYVIYNTIRLGTCLLTNWLLAYLRKRRLILDKPNVKFFIISLQYYFALQWISGLLHFQLLDSNTWSIKSDILDGWLTDELAVSRPLHSCVAPSNSSLYVILDFMILLYCTQAWEMYNGALSRKTKQVYLLDNDGDHKERKMNLF